MSLNGISTLATKELRQKAKLDLAAAKRAADGYVRATYDITQLPTQYNDNGIIDNPNVGGLVAGRPWVIGPVETQLETFTVVQTTDWTAPAGTTSVEYLVVGGGGGGGNGYDTGGGGGGAGGMMLTGTLAVTPGQTYTVIVGDGGTGGADARTNNAGTAGSNSVFATITALGGTGGQGSRTYSPTARYTGGAAQVGSITAPLGGGGGGAADAGGGGGGAGGAGGTRVSASSAGVGGAGVASLITGSSVTYGRGGAGGTSNVNNNDGAVGANNTGTGGGGGSATAGNSGGGGNGGSGIVVLKFTTPAEFTFYEAFGTTTTISTTQYVSGNKIYAESSTYDVPDFQPARVIVNDIEVANTELRGHTLVVLDSYGDVVVSATQFDTWDTGGAPEARANLASALNAVPSGNIVVLISYDASGLDAGIRSAINTGYGSTNTNTWLSGRQSQIFIGVKGTVTPTPPVTSGSMFIPGTSSRVTLTPGIVVGGTSTTPFTVEGWFYSTVTPGNNSGPVLLSTDTGSGTPSYAKALTINVSTPTQIIVDSNGAAQQAFNFAETMLVNTWYYVAVTRDSGGYIQVWLGKDGDANATASTTGRQPLNTAAWELTGLSNTIGAFVPAGRYTTGYISNLRVDSTGLYATTAATIPVPTAPFEELAGTVFLQNDDTLTDQTGTQTLAAVGSAAGDELNPF